MGEGPGRGVSLPDGLWGSFPAAFGCGAFSKQEKLMTGNFHPTHIPPFHIQAHSRCGATDDVSLCAKLAQRQACWVVQ